MAAAQSQEAVRQRRAGTPSGKAGASESSFVGLPQRRDDVPQSTPASNRYMQGKIDFIRSHFQNMFMDGVMTRENFDNKIFFQDPQTKTPSFLGYQAVVTFLRYFLQPIYELHDVKQVDDNNVVVRWTMSMQFSWNRYNPLKVIWDPRAVFTGITLFEISPHNGKISKHIDAWDAIEHQDFFSVEGFLFSFLQIMNVSKPPNLETPEFILYKKYKTFEIRKYKPFLVAEAEDYDAVRHAAGGGATTAAAAQGGQGEAHLRRYLGGDNARREKLGLTTPVFSDSDGIVRMYLGQQYQRPEDAPRPNDSAVKIREHPGGLYAATVFAGKPSREDLVRRAERLQHDATGPGALKLASRDQLVLAKYSLRDATPGPLRRNEILVPVDESSFEVWHGTPWDFVQKMIRLPRKDVLLQSQREE